MSGNEESKNMSYKQENFEEWIILIPVKMEY